MCGNLRVLYRSTILQVCRDARRPAKVDSLNQALIFSVKGPERPETYDHCT
jgi:hypothetical protein